MKRRRLHRLVGRSRFSRSGGKGRFGFSRWRILRLESLEDRALLDGLSLISAEPRLEEDLTRSPLLLDPEAGGARFQEE